MTTKIFYFLLLSFVIFIGFDIQSGRFGAGNTKFNDSTATYTTLNKGLLVNGDVKLGTHSLLYNTASSINATNTFYFLENAYEWQTRYTSPIVTLDSLNGMDLNVPLSVVTATGTATTGSDGDTIQGQCVKVTTQALTTAAGAGYTFTLTNSLITTSSNIWVSVSNGTNSQGIPVVAHYTAGSGTMLILLYNLALVQPLNGTLKFTILIIN